MLIQAAAANSVRGAAKFHVDATVNDIDLVRVTLLPLDGSGLAVRPRWNARSAPTGRLEVDFLAVVELFDGAQGRRRAAVAVLFLSLPRVPSKVRLNYILARR